jgi:hypothetical protein
MADLSSSGSHILDPADPRDSPRVPMKFEVRKVGSADGDWEKVEGDLSVGGALIHSRQAVFDAKQVDVKFKLPNAPTDVVVQADVLRVRDEAGGKGVHLKFVDVALDAELAIAKYIDDLIASLGS